MESLFSFSQKSTGWKQCLPAWGSGPLKGSQDDFRTLYLGILCYIFPIWWIVLYDRYQKYLSLLLRSWTNVIKSLFMFLIQKRQNRFQESSNLNAASWKRKSDMKLLAFLELCDCLCSRHDPYLVHAGGYSLQCMCLFRQESYKMCSSWLSELSSSIDRLSRLGF